MKKKKNLIALRLRAGLTQLEVSKIVKCTPQFICNMETGNGKAGTPMPVDKMPRFAKAYGVSTKTLADIHLKDYRRHVYKKLGLK